MSIGPTGPKGGFGAQGFRGEKGSIGPTGPSIDPAIINSKAPLNNPKFTGTVQGISQTMVGLGNVDNTSDADKQISTATQTALDTKAPINNPIFTGTVGGLNKSMVGLGNVDNTSDIDKEISTKTQTALDFKADITYVDEKISNLSTIKSINSIDLDTNGCYNITNLPDGNCTLINNLPEILKGLMGDMTGYNIVAISHIETYIYIGGYFQALLGTSANFICKYNTLDGTYSAVGGGVNGPVFSLCAVGTTLYIGGQFTSYNNNDGLGNITSNNICKYNTLDGTYSAMGGGVNLSVTIMRAVGTTLYIAGHFTSYNNNDGLGNIKSNRICKYNTLD